jgi:hypothetical protein
MNVRLFAAALAFLAVTAPLGGAHASQASRNATREQVRTLLQTAGSRTDVNIAFRPSSKAPYNFTGVASGLTFADSLEVVVIVTASDTVSIRVYPHYHGGYINLDKVKDSAGLMRKLLNFIDDNFFYWGADESGDVFSGYTVTLESGFPQESMVTVLRSIRSTDKFVGQLRPFI